MNSWNAGHRFFPGLWGSGTYIGYRIGESSASYGLLGSDASQIYEEGCVIYIGTVNTNTFCLSVLRNSFVAHIDISQTLSIETVRYIHLKQNIQ